jgi:uncharacterized membrane protein (UPF0127 family)
VDPKIVVARSLPARLRGMIGRSEEVALLLPRCRSVHTFGMRFALDLVWLAKDGSVLAIEGSIGPRRHAMARSARSVVEVREGWGPRFVQAGLEDALRR